VWTQEYDRDLNDLFALQCEIAQKVADCVAAKAKIPHAGKPIQGVHIASLRLRAFATWPTFFRTSRFFS